MSPVVRQEVRKDLGSHRGERKVRGEPITGSDVVIPVRLDGRSVESSWSVELGCQTHI